MRTLLAITVLLAMLVAAVPARAGAHFFGSQCTPVRDAQIDPLVSPGVVSSAHMHTFYGNTGVAKDSTAVQLEAWTQTSCADPKFNAAMWSPALYVNGVEHRPKFVIDYWWSDGKQRVVPWPAGLGLVAGSAAATASNPSPLNVVWYDCGGSSPLRSTPYDCASSSSGITAHVVYPNCWDGTGNTKNDVTYPQPYPLSFSGQEPPETPCPITYPYVLPMVHVNVRTGLYKAAGISRSSGSVYSLHADYWQTFHDQAYLAEKVDQCLNHGIGCGVTR